MSKIFQGLLAASLVFLETSYALPNAYVSWRFVQGPSTSINDEDSVSFIDTVSPYAQNTYPLANDNSNPFGIAVTPDGKKVYVAQTSNQLITSLDGQNGNLLNSFTLSIDTFVLRMAPDGKKCYVVSSKDGDGIAIIDTATDAVTYVPLNHSLFDIAFTPDGATAYISINHDNAFTKGGFYVMNTANNSVTYTLLDSTHQDTRGVAVSSDGKTAYFVKSDNSPPATFYLVNTADNSLGSTINLSSVAQGATIPNFIAVTPDGKKAFVTDGVADNITPHSNYYAVDLMALGATLVALPSILYDSTFAGSRGLAITPDGTKVFMAHDISVSVIDTSNNALLDTPIDGSPAPNFVAIPQPVPVPPSPVASVSVKGCSYRNVFLTQSEIFNVVVWDNPVTITPVSYQVYRDAGLTCLAGEVACRQFTDHNLQKNSSYSYYIVAVLANGQRVFIGQTTVCAR